MIDTIWNFLSTEGFQPHGMCLLWRPDVFWMHVVSDLLIAVSYFSIPAALLYLASKRPDLMYRWVIHLFGAFIVACGITHIAGIWTMWVPDYSLEAIFKVVTAGVSVTTAIALWPLMPKLLAIPSNSQLEEKNKQLSREVTDRKQAESRLQDLNNQLEKRVEERTARLSQANYELEQAREKADQANISKSRFLATMSHEIRTPMNGVMGATDILKRTRLTTEQHEYVDIVKTSSKTLLNLLNDILDLSKIEAGRFDLETIDFSINDLLSSIETLWSPSTREAGLNLLIQNNLTEIDNVRGDQSRLQQILNNLLGNAIKFSDQGDIRVEVSDLPRQDHRVKLRFSVSDTGIGISNEQKEQLFRPFSQADASTTRKYGGTGLGLSICRNLVQLMDGEIDVESRPDQGSTFWFTVNLEENSALPATADDEENDSALPLVASAERTLRILVADDNKVNRFVVSRMLDALNCKIDLVENGVEAVVAAMRSDYDLILMDIEMPEMDGIIAARQIRLQAGNSRQIPIVALTANAMRGDREKYLAAGLTDYVSKPVDRDDLIAAVSRHVTVSVSAGNTDNATTEL